MVQWIQLFVAVILFFVIFFGLSFILNMLLRSTWLMSFIYPIVVIIIVDKISTIEYIKNPSYAFKTAFTNLINISVADIIILLAGFAGTVVSGLVVKYLRKSGYQMF